MKFIHCSDLHLSSDMECRLTPEKARLRRKELFETFARIADYAASNGVTAVLLCGDIFDEGKPRFIDRKNFIDIVAAHPGVDFLCLAGNHDESLYGEEDLPKNLLCFGESWKTYSYGEVDIWGLEQSDANYDLFYATLKPDAHKTNIVLLHGQVIPSNAKPARDSIVLPLLRGKNIDYLALGHLHSYKCAPLDDRGVWCYSGCPEGRGYDECGEKGFVLLSIENGAVESEFIPFAKRVIKERRVSISGLQSAYEIERALLSALDDEYEENLVRVYLEGEVGQNADYRVDDLEKLLSTRFFSASVKDLTKQKTDYEKLKNELSLRGEFVRLVLESTELPEEDRDEILRCGIAALNGWEVSFR